jgi:hypothetical protein
LREWWVRTVLVLSAPRAVFVALRADSGEEAAQRSEPVLLIVILAGIAFVLSTHAAGRLMDPPNGYDALLIPVWTFLAGALYGGVAYWALGGVLQLTAVGLGTQGSYRRSRHVLAFAAVPVALSLVLWPVKLALFGSALFQAGGRDSGTAGTVFAVLWLAFLGWSVCLLVIGVRAVHGWTWLRAAATAAPTVVLGGLFLFF